MEGSKDESQKENICRYCNSNREGKRQDHIFSTLYVAHGMVLISSHFFLRLLKCRNELLSLNGRSLKNANTHLLLQCYTLAPFIRH